MIVNQLKGGSKMAEIKYGISSDRAAANSLVEAIEKTFRNSVDEIDKDETIVTFSSSSFSGKISQIKGNEIEYSIQNENSEYCPVSKEDFVKRAAQYDVLVLEGARKDINDALLKLKIETEKLKNAEIIDTDIKTVESAPELDNSLDKRKKEEHQKDEKNIQREEKQLAKEEFSLNSKIQQYSQEINKNNIVRSNDEVEIEEK